MKFSVLLENFNDIKKIFDFKLYTREYLNRSLSLALVFSFFFKYFTLEFTFQLEHGWDQGFGVGVEVGVEIELFAKLRVFAGSRKRVFPTPRNFPPTAKPWMESIVENELVNLGLSINGAIH